MAFSQETEDIQAVQSLILDNRISWQKLPGGGGRVKEATELAMTEPIPVAWR